MKSIHLAGEALASIPSDTGGFRMPGVLQQCRKRPPQAAEGVMGAGVLEQSGDRAPPTPLHTQETMGGRREGTA